MSRDLDTSPKILNPEGLGDWRSLQRSDGKYHGERRFVRGLTMVKWRGPVSHSIFRLLNKERRLKTTGAYEHLFFGGRESTDRGGPDIDAQIELLLVEKYHNR